MAKFKKQIDWILKKNYRNVFLKILFLFSQVDSIGKNKFQQSGNGHRRIYDFFFFHLILEWPQLNVAYRFLSWRNVAYLPVVEIKWHF